ncbi:Rha family transcriptional regulator [Salmonella enterica]|nr:Rha family transcriptional regulator [Salmonella enterica]EJJ4477249.1 Rha family transcriptional regulator [Salmonella enterica]EJJ4620757.1 Rha family transcriptional regulator [Salmonella enterica]
MNTVAVMNTNAVTVAANDSVEKELLISTWRIAEMMGREDRHHKIMQTVDRLVAAQVITKPPMGVWSKTDRLGRKGKNFDVYLLNERDSYIVIAQTDPVFTAQLVDEWKRLKEENEELKQKLIENPFANFEETDWIELALEEKRKNKKLVELHIRKSVDAHSMTRLLGEKRGSLLVQKALNALREAGYIERVYDDSNKPKGYIANDNSLTFCRMNAHFQLEFTVDVLPVLINLGVLEEEQKETLRLPQPNNTLLIQNKAAQKIRESASALTLECFGI